MANKISSAVGTEMQFMPQENNIYQEQLNGVSGAKGNPTNTSTYQYTSQALSNANSAWLAFLNDDEKRKDEAGLQAATNMINGATEKDIQTLNSIDLAQTYGYAKCCDNPYFIAYADNLRGSHAAAQLQSEYNEAYGDNPLTPDEEVKRYDEFAKAKLDSMDTLHTTMNKAAFTAGFDGDNQKNKEALIDTAAQRDVQNRVTESYRNIESKLSQIAYNAPSLGLDNTAAQIQQVMNGSRLMGLSPDQRYALIDKLNKNLLATGSFKNYQQYKAQVMDKVNVQTRLDGTSLTMTDLCDNMDNEQMCLAYNKAHINQAKLNFIKKHKNDRDKFGAAQEIIHMSNSGDRSKMEEAEQLEGCLGQIGNMQRATAAGRTSASKAAANSHMAAVRQAAFSDACAANLEAYMNGCNETDGRNPIGKVSLTDGKTASFQDYYQAIENKRQAIYDSDMSDTDKYDNYLKLWGYAGIAGVKDNIGRRILQEVNSGDVTAVQNGSAGTPDSLIELAKMRDANTGRFDSIMPTDLVNATSLYQQCVSSQGGNGYDDNAILNQAYASYLQYAGIDKKTRSGYTGDLQSWVNDGGTMDGIQELDTWDDDHKISISANDPVALRYLNVNYPLNAMSLSSGVAIQKCNDDFADSYRQLYGAVIPKEDLNLGTADDEHWGRLGIDALIQDYADNTAHCNFSDCVLSYNPDNKQFTVNNNYAPQAYTFTINDLANEATYMAENPPKPTVTITPTTQSDTSSSGVVATVVNDVGDWAHHVSSGEGVQENEDYVNNGAADNNEGGGQFVY